MAVLKSTVHVRNPESGQVEIFAPGSTPPVWAQKAITNPKAWETPPVLDTEDDPEQPDPDSDDDGDDSTDGSTEPDDDDPPPMSGPGSGEKAWRAYAARHDTNVADAKDRKGIIAELRKAGVRVE